MVKLWWRGRNQCERCGTTFAGPVPALHEAEVLSTDAITAQTPNEVVRRSATNLDGFTALFRKKIICTGKAEPET